MTNLSHNSDEKGLPSESDSGICCKNNKLSIHKVAYLLHLRKVGFFTLVLMMPLFFSNCLFSPPIEVRDENNHSPEFITEKVSPELYSNFIFQGTGQYETDITLSHDFSITNAFMDIDGDLLKICWYLDYGIDGIKLALKCNYSDFEGIAKHTIRPCKVDKYMEETHLLEVIITDGDVLDDIDLGRKITGKFQIGHWWLKFNGLKCTK